MKTRPSPCLAQVVYFFLNFFLIYSWLNSRIQKHGEFEDTMSSESGMIKDTPFTLIWSCPEQPQSQKQVEWGSQGLRREATGSCSSWGRIKGLGRWSKCWEKLMVMAHNNECAWHQQSCLLTHKMVNVIIHVLYHSKRGDFLLPKNNKKPKKKKGLRSSLKVQKIKT